MRASVTRARQIFLFAGDILCLSLGFLAALAIRYGFPIPYRELAIHRVPFAIIFAVWLMCFFIGGLYSLRNAKNNRSFFALFFSIFAVNAGIAVIFFYFVPYFSISPKTVLFLVFGIAIVLLFLWRIFFNHAVSLPPLKVAILGIGMEIDELIKDMEKHPQQGYKCILHLKSEKSVADYGAASLRQLFYNKGIDVVVIGIDYRVSIDLQKDLFDCISLNIRFYDFVDFYEQNLQKIPLAVIDKAWFLENINEPGKKFFSTLKRLTDIVIALVFGIVGLILIPFIALAIYIDIGSPVFFLQKRIGRFGKPFRIYKFRSMRKEYDKNSITFVCRFLRLSHLDEIPQLWNILKGDMSFVGPRPEQEHIVDELKKQIPFYAERLLIKPGITGWAQLYEPHAQAEDALRKLQYDLFYVKHRSVLLDLEIILKTLRILLA